MEKAIIIKSNNISSEIITSLTKSLTSFELVLDSSSKLNEVELSPYDIIFINNAYNLSNINKPVFWIDSVTGKNANKIVNKFYIPDGIIVFDKFSLKQSSRGILPKHLCKTIKQFPANQSSNANYNERMQKILVDIDFVDCFPELVLNLISLLNRITNIPIYWKANRNYASQINSNIHTIKNYDDTDLQNYSLIIANKNAAIKAIQSKTPCVIIGDNGYGGVVTEDNVILHLLNNFNGRCGGYFGEQIPIHLAYNDIISLQQTSVKQLFTRSKSVIDKLNNYQEAQLCSLSHYIHSVIKIHKEQKNNLNTVSLILNSFYSVSQFDNQQWMIKNPLGKLIFSLDGLEYSILNEFRKPSTIEEVIRNPVYARDTNTVRSFIKDLVKYKIIINNAYLENL